MRVDSYMAGVALVIGCALLANLGLFLARGAIDRDLLRSCHEVGGYLFSVVGTLYAVLLGLIVVDAIDIFQEARQTVERETNALASVVLLSDRLPMERRREILTLVSLYAEQVITREWAAMDRGGLSLEARRTARKLVEISMSEDPNATADDPLRGTRVEAALELWNSRRARLNVASQGIPALEWAVLIIGGSITVFFTFFFVVDNVKAQALMTALIAACVALNIYLVAMFGYPFSGDLRVDSSVYRVIQELANDSFPGSTEADPKHPLPDHREDAAKEASGPITGPD